MKPVSLIFVFILGFSSTVFGTVTPYEWEKNRTRYKLSKTDAALPELILKHHVRYEYALEDNQFIMYYTLHRIIVVNNTEAVQKHNRIYIPMRSVISLASLKARTITPDGKIINFDQSNLKEIKEEETGNEYKIFAIEGVELGSEIEYYYTRKMRGNIFDRAYLQFDSPVKNSSFYLSCPGHLKFDFKSYEGFAEVKKNEKEELNTYEASMENVSAMKKETFSNFDANRKRIEFKLAYNTAKSQARLYTWDDAARTFYPLLYNTTKDEDKALEKFVKSIQDNPSNTIDQRISNVEKKIKTSIRVNRDRGDDETNQLNTILKYKIASKEGITRLFIAVFSKLGIEIHSVLTCDRENTRFDGDFDSWSFLDDYLLYFPATEKFIAPYTFEMRYPLIPFNWTAQDGLFIEPFVSGSLKSGLASVNPIPAIDYTLSKDDLDIEVKFSSDISSAEIHQKRIFSGYNAAYFAPFYDMMTEEKKKELIENIIKQTAPDLKFKTWQAKPVENDKTMAFLVDATFTSEHFVEVAGNRILFKAGELIGPQVEMYRDDERLTRVENDFNRGYDRKIKIIIPDGYKVKNADDLKINIRYVKDKEEPYLFYSDYTIKGNTIEIRIEEYYKEIYADISRYEDYRKVINAAADFNKVTLVLEPVGK